MYYPVLEKKIDLCSKCEISSLDVNIKLGKMFGFGGSFVMICGEAPSFIRGNPSRYTLSRDHSSYSAGVLYKALDAIKWPIEKTYFTNIMKCSTPENRDPKDSEIDTCYNNWFLQELYLVNPLSIVSLGKYVTKYLLSKSLSIPIFPIEHFSYIYRNQSKYSEWEVKWEEIRQKIRDYANNARKKIE